MARKTPDGEFGDNPSPEKEDAVREALGVERKFEVYISVPITGIVHLKEIVVMAVDEENAKEKAVKLFQEGGVDIDGCKPDEAEHGYEYVSTSEWIVNASPTD